MSSSYDYWNKTEFPSQEYGLVAKIFNFICDSQLKQILEVKNKTILAQFTRIFPVKCFALQMYLNLNS